MTTSSSVPEARGDLPREPRGRSPRHAPGDGTRHAPGDGTEQPANGERAEVHDEPLFEPFLHLEQGALDGLARPLAETEFVVFDLETSGGSPAEAAITEIGAVRTRGAAQHALTSPPGAPGAPGGAAGLREFATLVNPGRAIPPHVAALTGISDATVTAAPRIEEVLPRFLEFARGAVLVAHNAPFDIGFLRAACARHNLAWPALPTLDTAALARRMLTTDEVHDCKLATLAGFFHAGTQPTHRALDDARATTAVLHGLLDRLARRGVHTLEALRGFGLPPPPQLPGMRLLTAAIPRAPGVCLFTAADGRVLHVVRSSDMYARACGYFTAAETRDGIREMISKTARIVPIRCATTLEAEVAEIRLNAVHLPPYGTGARARTAHGGTGPRAQAALGNGTGPQAAGGNAAEGTDPAGLPGRAGHTGSCRGPGGPAQPRQAGSLALAEARRVVAARPRFAGGWDVAWIAHGLLEATAVLPRGADVTAGDGGRVPAVRLAVPPGSPAAAAARDAETACLLDWLESAGVRLIEVQGTWSVPVPG